jgi:hypothetical protein
MQPLHIFREDNRSPFTLGRHERLKMTKDTGPVEIVWSFLKDDTFQQNIFSGEITGLDSVIERPNKTLKINIYKQNYSNI